MWPCSKCGERIDESFDACWKCGTSKDEAPAVTTNTEAESCPSCQTPLEYMGRKSFHEGTKWGALGDLSELFVNREHFDVYMCPHCRRVEFFVDRRPDLP